MPPPHSRLPKVFGTPEEHRRHTAAGKRQETAGYRSECQLHALPQRRLVLLLAGDKADEHAGQYNTILEAFTNKFGADNIIYEAGVTYKQGGNWWEENAPEIEKAVAAAAGADLHRCLHR